MKVRNVVKVMNFHSLLRVDRARKEAEKYFVVEKELRSMIDSITNNRNIVLDKWLLRTPKDKPVLNIYIGSDLGFCGAYNYIVNQELKKDNSVKILIGKKVKCHDDVLYSTTKEEYMDDPTPVSNILKNGIIKLKYSEINVFYNQYINAGTIPWTKKRIYPFEYNEEKAEQYHEDYVSEDDIGELVLKMVSTYVDYELQITVKNSFASENIMRQNSTNDSLKKIDELDELHAKEQRKINSAKASQKNIERYVKKRYRKAGV